MFEGMIAGEVVGDVKHKLRVDGGSRKPGDRCEEESGVKDNFAAPPYSPLGGRRSVSSCVVRQMEAGG